MSLQHPEPSPFLLCCRTSQTPPLYVAMPPSQYLSCPCPDPPPQPGMSPSLPSADLAIFSVLFFSLPFLFLNSDAHSAGALPGLPTVLLQPLPREAATGEEIKHLQFGQSHTWFLNYDQDFVTGVTSTFCQTIASPPSHLCSRH